MENKENIINELYRNMQLMQIDNNILNEQNFLKNLFKRASKFLIGDSIQNFIQNNSAFKNLIDNPRSTKQKNLKIAYDAWSNNPNDKTLQYNLIDEFLNVDYTPTGKDNMLSLKAEFLEKGLNIGHNRLSSILGKILNNESDIDNIIKSYKITDQGAIDVIKKYYSIYKTYGGRRKELTSDAIERLKTLAKDSGFWETFRLYKQTINSIAEGWKYGKEALEIKMLDKYNAYLDQIKNVQDQTQIETITLAYKKTIENTYRAYLIIQDDLATSQIHSLANTLRVNKNPNAIEFSNIIEALKTNALGSPYPGFDLTTHLVQNQNPSFLKILWKSIVPFNSVHNVYEFTTKYPTLNKHMNKPFTKGLRRVFVFGAFPNKELLYTLIASNKLGLQQKKKLTLFKLYLQYSFLGAIRSSIQTSLLPMAYGIWTIIHITTRGGLESNNINIPGISKLTDEEKEKLKSENFFVDALRILLSKYKEHLYKTWTTIGDVGSGGWDSKIYKAAAGIGIPNEVKSFNDSIIAKVILFGAGIDTGNMVNKDYKSLYNMIVSGLDEMVFGGAKKDIENKAKTEGERIQAGGTEIDVNTKTWSYSTTSLPNSKIVEINFPFNQTQKVVVNDKYNLDNRFFKNINNKVGINVPNKIEPSSIKVVDVSNTTHSFQKK